MSFLSRIKNHKTFVTFFKFGIVGFSNTVIAYSVYALLVRLGVYYIMANIISFFAGVINSFYWNNKYVFRNRKNKGTRIAFIKAAVSYALTGIILANLLLYFLVETIKISRYLAPLFILIVTVPSNFFLHKFWVFREKGTE